MQITNILFDFFIFLMSLSSICLVNNFNNFLNILLTNYFLNSFLNSFYILLCGKFVLHFVIRLIRKSMHVYQATNTLLESHNQLQNKNIHINFFIFSLWQMQQLIFCVHNSDARNLG